MFIRDLDRKIMQLFQKSGPKKMFPPTTVSKSIYPIYTVQVSFNFLFVYHFIFRKKVTLLWSLGKVNFQKGMVEYYQSPKW